jgi:hypothetical protein
MLIETIFFAVVLIGPLSPPPPTNKDIAYTPPIHTHPLVFLRSMVPILFGERGDGDDCKKSMASSHLIFSLADSVTVMCVC